MKYPKIVLSLVIVSIGAILGAIFQYQLYLDFLWTLEGLAIFVPLSLAIGLVVLGFGLAKLGIGKFLGYTLAISCSCIASLVVFEITGSLIDRWKIDAVESYVARAVPVLDKIQQRDGSYPSELPINLLGEPPELLRNYGDYHATGSSFRFEYEDEPAGWAGGEGLLEFDSYTRKWENDRG